MKTCFPLLALSLLCLQSNAQTPAIQDKILTANWQMQSSEKVAATDAGITNANFQTTGWYPARVPGTVMGSLVALGQYKDIFMGNNLEKVPDTLFAKPWWFRNTFSLTAAEAKSTARLEFNGINYRADIWLNGHLLAKADSVRGGFRRFTFDVSAYIKEGENILAVKVTRPGPGDPTLGFVDWNPMPPDHNLGIWREVHLVTSGAVSITQPFVAPKLDTATLDHASLTISALLHNNSKRTVSGVLKGSVEGGIEIAQPVTLKAGESKEIVFTPAAYQQLEITHPRVWWTHDLGKPELYRLQLRFENGGKLEDSTGLHFGIRSITDYFTPQGHRGYKLNGKNILVKGGGWTDRMLLDASPGYENAGMDYAVQMHLNTIRMEGFWGSNHHLYDLADEKGLLIMVGYSAAWEWSNFFGNADDKYGAISKPEQMYIAATSWKDQVIWLRNHPAVCVWMYGSDKLPRPALESQYIAILKKYDTTRCVLASAQEHTSKLSGPSAVKMRGPYDYVPPAYWYVDTKLGGAFGFNTETGPGPQVPVLETLQKMIPADSLWPVGSGWMFHAARGEFHNLTAYDSAIEMRLGKPTDLHDYLRKAQYINYEGMRAMYEAFEAHRFQSTGIIQWMYNASWPKLWWQLYDFYLLPTGAFYGAQKANEPVHIAYDYGRNAVMVLNNTNDKMGGYTAVATGYDGNLQMIFESQEDVPGLQAQETKYTYNIPGIGVAGNTWFLNLQLKDREGTVVSRNFYALSMKEDELDNARSNWYITPIKSYGDLTKLQTLPMVKLESDIKTSEVGEKTLVTAHLRNPASTLAFMAHLDIRNAATKDPVGPVFWKENDVTLMPGEEITLEGWVYTRDLGGRPPLVTTGGWNVE
ncbi:glycoside hydrolase family 2 [Chitinophaga parva]|uniref:Glycoside hydrolase family 2 n=1 Tax=Chitinophaga parva TaxID=2169414 RepID=A0A2T7BHG1_9BACT|nr:sugar-binding domain-containing protein [Chitinophaga parva]PUZ25683.1 glycoside hydrolase family 2 [Chitinophaga parva]